MSGPYGDPLLIANPAAGRGREPVLARLRDALAAAGLAPTVATTAGPGDAGRIAHRAVTAEGRRFVVAVGGDGTVHEVVNGLVDPETGRAVRSDVVMGAVAGGSGCDFVRTFGIDLPPERAVRHLVGESVFPIDLGRVRFVDPRGDEQVRVFANIAEVGYGGVVTELAAGLPRLLGAARYLLAVLLAMRRFDLVEATVTLDHTEIREPTSNVVVANGQFFGGGMKVAPRALPDDGTFNVQCWRGSTRDVTRMLPRIRAGEHLGSGEVREYQSSTVRVTSARPMTLEADGEVLGTTPITCDVLPDVLRLKV